METATSQAIAQLSDYLRGLTHRLDPGAGWYGEFLRRDPEGMRACMEGAAMPPWDVVESLLADLAAARGEQFAARETQYAARLRAEAVAAWDRLPGGAEELRTLRADAADQRAVSEAAARTLAARLAATGDRTEAAAVAAELAWVRDDAARAAARQQDFTTRLEALPPDPLPGLPRQRTPEPQPPTAPPYPAPAQWQPPGAPSQPGAGPEEAPGAPLHPAPMAEQAPSAAPHPAPALREVSGAPPHSAPMAGEAFGVVPQSVPVPVEGAFGGLPQPGPAPWQAPGVPSQRGAGSEGVSAAALRLGAEAEQAAGALPQRGAEAGEAADAAPQPPVRRAEGRWLRGGAGRRPGGARYAGAAAPAPAGFTPPPGHQDGPPVPPPRGARFAPLPAADADPATPQPDAGHDPADAWLRSAGPGSGPEGPEHPEPAGAGAGSAAAGSAAPWPTDLLSAGQDFPAPASDPRAADMATASTASTAPTAPAAPAGTAVAEQDAAAAWSVGSGPVPAWDEWAGGSASYADPSAGAPAAGSAPGLGGGAGSGPGPGSAPAPGAAAAGDSAPERARWSAPGSGGTPGVRDSGPDGDAWAGGPGPGPEGVAGDGPDTAPRRRVQDVVAELIALRGQGRSGEAHVVLCEAAAWPAGRLPALAAELGRAGLAADWATLLWEAASLPPDRLAAAAAALGEAGRHADCEALLRQGVARPAAEIAEAALTLAAAGRPHEADALLGAFVRVRTAEEAARLARRDPQWFTPRLLAAAAAVSAGHRRDLVHALRIVAKLPAD
ncbi:hypothetical protein ABZ924_08015 [Streptomyces sp. NPDC046876]|uniref:hypothetical protein n=1 Tax=Streptomyces sp. NPDC046876 TaxID=3155616 RepID=UPI0033C86997